jgi:hypothetical protein
MDYLNDSFIAIVTWRVYLKEGDVVILGYTSDLILTCIFSHIHIV